MFLINFDMLLIFYALLFELSKEVS